MLSSAILVFTAIGNLFLVLIVLAKDYRKLLHWALAWMALSLTAWLVAGYYSNLDTSISLFWNRAVFIGPIVIPVALVFFVQELSAKKVSNKKTNLALFLIALFFLVSLLTPLFVKGVEARMEFDQLDGYDLIRGPLYYVFLVYLAATLIYAVSTLYGAYRKSSGSSRAQLQIILIGTFLAIIWSLFFSVILPIALNSSKFSILGTFSGLILVSFYAYAIVKHQFLDIRFVIARTLAYALSLSVLVGAYIGLVLGAGQLFSIGPDLSAEQRAFYVVLSIVFALTLSPLKKFFDKLTNSVFYRDAYDSQELLDRLNKVLVSTSDIDRLLRETSQIVGDTLKTEYVSIGVSGDEGPASYRIIGTDEKRFKKTDITLAQQLISVSGLKILVSDYLERDKYKIRKLMNDNGVAVVVRLIDDPNKEVEDIGYMLLGNKKSGSPFSSQDIKVLTLIADELILAIQNALRFEEIQNFNKTLEKEVEDATRKLRRVNDKLVALDQTKDDFISMASHQLRTPLTSVKGYISMVLEGDAGQINKDQKELLGQAFVSSQRMVYLISDLLNVSRLRTGKFVIEPTEINLADIVESEVAQLRETASARGLKISYDKPKNFPVLMLDETKIRQVLTNYMDNAIYYTPSNGKIKVELKDSRQSIELLVKDSGIGVPRHEQHNLFTKFFRAGNAKKARPDGTGLGLFMAKKVIIAQGGAVIFNSTEGKGSTFGFTFPKTKVKVLSK